VRLKEADDPGSPDLAVSLLQVRAERQAAARGGPSGAAAVREAPHACMARPPPPAPPTTHHPPPTTPLLLPPPAQLATYYYAHDMQADAGPICQRAGVLMRGHFPEEHDLVRGGLHSGGWAAGRRP
jgi:hypothetical protein